MAYKIKISEFAQMQLDNILYHIVFQLNNSYAAKSVLKDFQDAVERLSYIAGSLPLCNAIELKEKGYRKIHFRKHNYLIMYRVCDDCVQVDGIYHELEDYEKLLL